MAEEGGGGVVICWCVMVRRFQRISTQSAGLLMEGEAWASCWMSGGRVGSHPVAIIDAEKPWGSWTIALSPTVDAWDLLHPCLGGSALKQASSEHVVHGPMAALVDGVPLRMVRRSQDALDAQRPHQLPPNITRELTTAVGQETAWGDKVWHHMPEESFAHCVCVVVAGRYKDSVSGIAIHKHDEEFLSVVGRERSHNVHGERVP